MTAGGCQSFTPMNKFQEQPSVVILIDCWDAGVDRNQRPYQDGGRSTVKTTMYNNIVEKFSKLKKLQGVLLATYQSQEHQSLSESNLFYQNSYRAFGNYRLIPATRNQFFKDINDDGGDGTASTDPKILNYQWPGSQYAITRTWHLKLLFEKYFLNVKDIYVAGDSWNACVRTRPVGVDALLNLKRFGDLPIDSRILAMRDTVLEYSPRELEIFMNPEAHGFKQLDQDRYLIG
jgi:hypothetical protein